jgi:hypothetical protein
MWRPTLPWGALSRLSVIRIKTLLSFDCVAMRNGVTSFDVFPDRMSWELGCDPESFESPVSAPSGAFQERALRPAQQKVRVILIRVHIDSFGGEEHTLAVDPKVNG